jgi:hypothetical protein
MVSSSRKWNVASMFFQTCQPQAFKFPGRVELVVMDLQHDYEHEHEKATSELGVERLPNFELLLTANGISAGIAA